MKREIFRSGGRYEMCHILYHGDKYMVAQRNNGEQIICSPAYGTWAEISPMDLISRLERLDRLERAPARGMEAGTAETPQAAPCGARQPDLSAAKDAPWEAGAPQGG